MVEIVECSEKETHAAIAREMLVLALSISIKYTLKSHIFIFKDTMYKQSKGGAIGVGLAGEVANLFMVWWDTEIRMLMRKHKISIKLYSRYVDDIDVVAKAITCERNIEKDKMTMEKIQRLANTIHPSIRVTIDSLVNLTIGDYPY